MATSDTAIDNGKKKDAALRDFANDALASRKAMARAAEESFASRLKHSAYWAEDFAAREAREGTNKLDFLQMAEWVRTENSKELIIRDSSIERDFAAKHTIESINDAFGSAEHGVYVFERCRVDLSTRGAAALERGSSAADYYRIDYLIDEIGVEEKQNNAYKLTGEGILLYYAYFKTAAITRSLLRK